MLATADDSMSAGPRDALISGAGVVCAAGDSMPSLAAALRTQRETLSPWRLWQRDSGEPLLLAQVQSEIANPGKLDRSTAFAVHAASEAMENAGLQSLQGLRACVLAGTASGGLEAIDLGYHDMFRRQRTRPSPFTVPRTMSSGSVTALCSRFSASGMGFAVGSACASSSHALALGSTLVRSGAVDIALVGGTDAPFTEGNLRAWESLRVLSSSRCRPFSAQRDGVTLGEGAAFFVIEAREHREQRRVSSTNVWGEIVGAGYSSGSAELVRSDSGSYQRAIQAALDAARWDPGSVDYINAHGTGTIQNDAAEAAAITAIFGSAPPACSSLKGLLGHTLGASGAIELAATLIGMRESFAPHNFGLASPEPSLGLNLVADEPRPLPIRRALKNSFAFGDLCCVLAVQL